MSPQLPSYKCWKWECVRNASDVSSCNVNIWHPLCCVTGDKAVQMCTDVYVKIQHLFAAFLLSFLLLWRDLRGFVGNIVLVFSRTFPLVLAAVWWHGSVSSACQGHTEMPENKSTDLTEMPVIQKENEKTNHYPSATERMDKTTTAKKGALTCGLQQTRIKTNVRKPFRSRGKNWGNKKERWIPAVHILNVALAQSLPEMLRMHLPQHPNEWEQDGAMTSRQNYVSPLIQWALIRCGVYSLSF